MFSGLSITVSGIKKKQLGAVQQNLRSGILRIAVPVEVLDNVF